VRIDPAVEPEIHRGATISRAEIDSLRTVERVVRMGKVRQIGTHEIALDGGAIGTNPTEVHVDCTARGVPWSPARRLFEPGKITIDYITLGIAPWSAATVAAVETVDAEDAEKNRLAPAVPYTGEADDLLGWVYGGLAGQVARMSNPELTAWNDRCRLNPARAAGDHAGDPRIAAAYTAIFASYGAAMRNLAQRTAAGAPSPV